MCLGSGGTVYRLVAHSVADGARPSAALAVVLQALYLSRCLEGTGVSAFLVHPGWIHSNLAQGAVRFVQNALLRPFSGLLGTVSWFECAQTTLHLTSQERKTRRGLGNGVTSLDGP